MSKKKTQKILIPKGTINPDEDTLIEIPLCLKDQAVVVATRTGSEKILRPSKRKKDTTEVNFTLDDTSTAAASYINTDSFSPSFNSTFQPTYHESDKLYSIQRQTTNFEGEEPFNLSLDPQPTYFEPDKPFQQSVHRQPTFYDSDKPFQQSTPHQHTFTDSEGTFQPTAQRQPTFYDSDRSFQPSMQHHQSSFQQTVLDVPVMPNLDETERAERKIIQKKLEDFQQARRELFIGASTVATNSSQLVPQVDFMDDFESSFPLSSTLTPSGTSSSSCKGYVRDTSILSRRCNRKADSPVPSPINEDDDSILPLYKNSKVNSEKSKTSGYLSHEETCVLNRKPYSPRVSYRSFDEEKMKIPTLFDGDEDEEEKICLCLSKSINSMSKSSHGSSKRR